jgi:hypothetical protein
MNRLLIAMLAAGSVWANAQDEPPTPSPAAEETLNVNERYTVERVEVKRKAWQDQPVSAPLKKELDQLPGKKLNQDTLDKLAERLKKDLHVDKIDVQVTKGTLSDQVVVTFDARESGSTVGMHLSQFLYHSKQGWSGAGGVSYRHDNTKFTFGLVSDADRLTERYAGIQAGFEQFSLGTDRVGLRFHFYDYHQQWNRTTLESALPGELYRTRQHFVPEVVVRLAKPLEWTAGVDFSRYRTFLPNPVALGPTARTESSNAAVTTLRYRSRWDSGSDYKQEFTASYGLRSGTGVLESDAIFTRQLTEAQYQVKHGHQTVKVGFLGGRIGGSAPMFERFVLGNAETLRGWNKFDLNPRGATRAVHGSIDYIYRVFLLFYDTGASWNVSEDPEQKQSLGLGLVAGGLRMSVGFPVRSGHANPVVYVGMNF